MVPLPPFPAVIRCRGMGLLIILILGACSTNIPPLQIPVTTDQASSALERARSVLDAPYVWGGNGPDEFDCSGLIVWSYQEVLGDSDIFYTGASVVSDVTMQMFYDHNSIPIEDPLPGDIVFITTEEGVITHGGLVEDVTQEGITFIHASSFAGKVISEDPAWPVNGMIRDQWIAGFGRFKFCR